MPPRRRLLCAAIILFLTAATICAVAYPLSIRYYSRWESTAQGATIIIYHGGIHLWTANTGFAYTGMREGLVAGPQSQLRSGFDPDWPLLPAFGSKSATGTTIPLYAPLLLALVPAVLLLIVQARLRRRARIGYCATCGYDR